MSATRGCASRESASEIPPVAITAGANLGGFACYFHDPDGITLELLQPSPERLAALGLQ